MEQYSNNILINGIRHQDKNILKYVYDTYYPNIRKYIVDSNGSEDDAKDIFQEAIIVLFRKSKDENFEISNSFENYLFAICKLMWFKQCKVQSDEDERINLFLDENYYDSSLFDKIELNRKYKLYQYHFNELRPDCKKILKLFIKGVSFNEIARKLKYKSGNYVKKRKYFCKEILIEKIKKDPKYKT